MKSDRVQKSEVRGQRSEVRGQGTGDREQETGDGRQGTGGRGRHSAFRRVDRWVFLGVVLTLGMAAGCSTPQPRLTDADWVSHSTTGRGAYERGDFRRAGDAYGRALLRAQALDDAEAVAITSVNRAICLLADGRAVEADLILEAALGDSRVPPVRRAELLVARARTSLAREQPDDALAQGEEALAPSTTRAQARLARSAAWLAKGDPTSAGLELAEGMTDRQWNRLPVAVLAERLERLGQIDAAFGDCPSAANHFDAAADRWGEAVRLPERARALAQAGRHYRGAGDPAAAGDRFYRAARSLWALRLADEAVQVLDDGVACAAAADDEVLGRKMAALVVTFQGQSRLNEQE